MRMFSHSLICHIYCNTSKYLVAPGRVPSSQGYNFTDHNLRAAVYILFAIWYELWHMGEIIVLSLTLSKSGACGDTVVSCEGNRRGKGKTAGGQVEFVVFSSWCYFRTYLPGTCMMAVT